MPKQTESAFHRFDQLPLELRLKIWAYTLPAPRIVDIVATSTDERQHVLFLSSVEGEEGERRRAKAVRSIIDHVYTPYQNVPALLSVNRETRDLMLQRWKVLEVSEARGTRGGLVDAGDVLGPSGVGKWLAFTPSEVQNDGLESMFYLAPPAPRHSLALFNPELDVLFLADPPTMSRVSSLAVIVRWLDQTVIESVTRLAIPYYSWRKDWTFRHLGLLLKFKSLKRLWVCFVGDGQERREGWLGAVARERDEDDEGYLKDVREQVWGDLEELERKEVGWRRPWVSIVRNRGAVMYDMRKDMGMMSGD